MTSPAEPFRVLNPVALGVALTAVERLTTSRAAICDAQGAVIRFADTGSTCDAACIVDQSDVEAVCAHGVKRLVRPIVWRGATVGRIFLRLGRGDSLDVVFPAFEGVIVAQMEADLSAVHGEVARLRAFVEAVDDRLVALDLQGRVAWANGASSRAVGLAHEDVIGKSVFDFVSPDSRESAQKAFAGIVSGIDVGNVELRSPSPAGIVDLEVRGAAIYENGAVSGTIHVARDVTERNKVIKDKLQAEASLRRVIEGSEDLLFVLDLDARYVYAGGSQRFGIDTVEIIGKSPEDYLPPEQAQLVRARLRSVAESRTPAEFETSLVWNGETVHFHDSVYPIFDDLGAVVQICSISRNITRQVLATRALAASEQRFRELADSIPDPFFVVDRNMVVTYANRAAIDVSRTFRQDATGMRLSSMHAPCIGPDSEAFVREVVEAEVALTRTLETQTRAYQVTAYPTPDGVAVLSRDVSAQKSAAEELQRSRHFLQRVLDGTPGLIYIYDLAEGTYKFTNREVALLLGYAPGEPDGVGPNVFAHLLHSEDAGIVNQHRRGMLTARDDEVHTVEYRLRHADGGWRWFRSSDLVFARAPDGSATQILGSAEDVTPRREASMRIAKLNDELERKVWERTSELENAVQELESFSYTISHDLRAPLRAIDGYAAMLLDDAGDKLLEESLDHIAYMRRNVQRMGDLIDDLLAFSRLGRQRCSMEPVDLDKIVEDVLEDLGRLYPAANAQIKRKPLPPVEGDPALIHQIYANLLSNALKFSIASDPQKIEIGCREIDGEHEFYVKDNGIGFEMAYADKLFGVFQRLHRTEEYEGTGVGLAIVERVVKLHGGRVWAQSKPGRGATFYFTLPHQTQ